MAEIQSGNNSSGCNSSQSTEVAVNERGFFTTMWFVLGTLDISIPFLHCLLFGALISPTDPIVVLAILKITAVPRSLQADIADESLLNDSVAAVVFLSLFQLAGGVDHGQGGEFGIWEITTLFSREVIGGLALGFAGALIAKRALKIARIDTSDILVTVTTVMAVYAAAWKLHVFGPWALVVVGIMLRGALHESHVDVKERDHVEVFWESIGRLHTCASSYFRSTPDRSHRPK